MAKAAILESASANPFSFGRPKSDVTMKRKTPTELRGEQLKRRIGEPLRVNEVYPVKKSSERCRVLSGKEKAKDHLTNVEILNDLVNPFTACGFPGSGKSSLSCDEAGKHNNSECSNPFAKDIDDQGSLKNEKNNQHNVAELHLGKKKSDSAKIDMEKVLKGLVTCHIPTTSSSLADSSGKLLDLPSISPNNYSELHIPGHRPPLDFTLKTSLRLVSSASVKWCHRLSTNPTTINLNQFTSQSFCNNDQNFDCKPGLNAPTEVRFFKALHSWTYPQSSLPASIISAMALSSSRGEADFLLKRQQDWEDSFRNLYYLLRKSLCNTFYVYTSQFVVLFIGGIFSGKKKKRSCNAYISQSTRGLRSLLRKHDIYFSMPLCRAEVEQAADDDLAELSEIEKRNLGQTFHLDSLSDVDNSSQSLLAFIGNENVHSLFDFLLNYRFFLNSLTGVDVPVLYSPVPFQNACLCAPEVRCKEMRRADMVVSSSGSDTEGAKGTLGLTASGICYSMEIKDTVLPPWIVCGVCVAMGSAGRAFESSFTTDPASTGLNVALDSVCEKSEKLVPSNKSSVESGDAFGIPEAVLAPCLRSASLRRLEYSDGSYKAHVIPA